MINTQYMGVLYYNVVAESIRLVNQAEAQTFFNAKSYDEFYRFIRQFARLVKAPLRNKADRDEINKRLKLCAENIGVHISYNIDSMTDQDAQKRLQIDQELSDTYDFILHVAGKNNMLTPSTKDLSGVPLTVRTQKN